MLTPRYFQSPECRREFQYFARRASALGVKELILPIVYADVPALHLDKPDDDLVGLVRTFQWEDWRELRFLELPSEGYRRAVARIASRIVEVNRRIEVHLNPELTLAAKSLEPEDSESAPGYLDRLAKGEEAFPKLGETTLEAGSVIEEIGRIVSEGTEDMQRAGKRNEGVKARLVIANRTAQRLKGPAERIWSIGNSFASNFHDVDLGMRALIESTPAEIKSNPDFLKATCDFFAAVRVMSHSVHESSHSTQSMVDAIGSIENLSRDLRPVLRRMRQGLTTMVEASEVSDAWVQMINALNLPCEKAATQ